MSIRLLICGDRWWGILKEKNKISRNENEISFIKKVILKFLEKEEIEAIIQGEAQGADSFAKEIAEDLKIPVLSFPPDWVRYGKKAGAIRNRQMLSNGNPNIVIGFHNNILKSKGTKDMINIARQKKVPNCIFDINMPEININTCIDKLLYQKNRILDGEQINLL